MTTNDIALPDQPDGIEDDSYDLPEVARAAERVGEYICANGDGMYDVIDGHPLYARDIEALRRAGDEVEQLRAEVGSVTRQLTAVSNELEKVRAQLTAANHHTDNLAAKDTVIKAAKVWRNNSGAYARYADECGLAAAVDALTEEVA